MKVVKVSAFGSTDVLQVENVAAPSAGAGQVVIKIEATGVGFVDLMMRAGTYQPLPTPGFVPGVELAGTIITTGEGVDEALVGTRAYALIGQGACAELAVVDAAALIPIPDGIDSTDAVALGVNAIVAQVALKRMHAAAGETVLVRGASGGIGIMATQLAAALGCRVITASASVDALKAYGAARTSDRNASDVEEEFDVIVDPVGGAAVPDFLGRLKANGRMTACGGVSGFPNPDFASPLLANFGKSLTISALSLNSVAPAEMAATLLEVFELALAGKLKAVIHARLPLEGTAEAHRQIEQGTVFGKIVIVP
jgi:NADPH2:quinone reductase